MDDTQVLVDRAQEGDKGALSELFDRYLPRVHQIVALRLGRRKAHLETENDLVQESMLKALRAFPRFQYSSEGAFRNFIAKVVQHAIVDRHRRETTKKRGAMVAKVSLDLSDSSTHGPSQRSSGGSPSEYAIAKELEVDLEAAMLSLRHRRREILVLRNLCKMSFEDIAQEMGFDQESSARTLYARAKTDLAEILGPRWHFQGPPLD